MEAVRGKALSKWCKIFALEKVRVRAKNHLKDLPGPPVLSDALIDTLRDEVLVTIMFSAGMEEDDVEICFRNKARNMVLG